MIRCHPRFAGTLSAVGKPISNKSIFRKSISCTYMYFAEVPISPMVIFASLLQGTCLMCVHGSDADITVYSEIFCCELLQTANNKSNDQMCVASADRLLLRL